MILSALVFLFVGLLVSVVIFVFLYLREISYFLLARKCMRRVPGPLSTSIFGNILPLLDTPENAFQVLRKWGTECYPIYCSWFSFLTLVNIVNPYDFELIMSNMKHNTKGYIYSMLHNWLGTGLITSRGNKWQERRKMLTPSFHFNILQESIKVFNEETKNLVEVFKQQCIKPYIAVTDYISDFTLNTISETAMGTNLEEDKVKGREYRKAIHEIGQLFLFRALRPWLLLKIFYVFVPHYYKEERLVKTLHNFTNDVITKRQENFKSPDLNLSYSKRKRLAMLDLLLAAQREENCIDDDGIREEVDTFMFAGHDTTSAAISFALMLLACHRDIQDLVYEEMHQVLPDTSNPNFQNLQDLKYMERCIKEVLRLYPSVPFIARILGEDVTTHSNHLLKAFSMVTLHIYDVHHNPDIYPDPEKFDPDRFLPENCQDRHNFAYVPFSAGPRNCIGQKFGMLEIKTVLCGILSEFILEPVDTPSSIVLVVDMVLRTKESIKVKFVPRKDMQ